MIMSFIENFFASVFGGNPAIATVCIALLPVVELRGAIPFGTSEKLFGFDALGIWSALLLGVLSCIFVASVLLLLLRPVFEVLKKIKGFNKVIFYLEEKFVKKANKVCGNDKRKNEKVLAKNGYVYGMRNSEQVEKKAQKKAMRRQLLFIVLFASVPLPLTGVWTASAVAVFLGLPYLRSLLAISVGTMISGLIMVGVTLMFGQNAAYLFHAFVILAVLVLVGLCLRSLLRRRVVQLQ